MKLRNDLNRLNLPTTIPHKLNISIGEPVGGIDKRAQNDLTRGIFRKKKKRKKEAIGISAGGYGIPIHALQKFPPDPKRYEQHEQNDLHKVWAKFKDHANKLGFTQKVVGDFAFRKGRDPQNVIRLISSKGGRILVYHPQKGRYYLEEDNKMREKKTGKIFYRVVDMDERGIYRAHVEDADGREVFSYSNEYEEEREVLDDEGKPTGEYETVTILGELWLIDDGYMKHVDDLAGLERYLKEMKIIPWDASLYDESVKYKMRHRMGSESFKSKAMKIISDLCELNGKTMNEVRVSKEFGSYNSRRYGKPWIAKVTKWQVGKPPELDFGRYVGDDSGGEVEIDAEVGSIIRIGQKDFRSGRGGFSGWYVVQPSGELKEVSPVEARKIWDDRERKKDLPEPKKEPEEKPDVLRKLRIEDEPVKAEKPSFGEPYQSRLFGTLPGELPMEKYTSKKCWKVK